MTVSRGLSTAEAGRRLNEFGPNRPAEMREETFFEELLESLREPLVLLLLFVGVLYAIFGELRDALIVFGVILTVAVAESSIEWRAGRAIKALSGLAQPRALVHRDGILHELSTEHLVPGDLIELRAGIRVPADAHLLESADLAIDEAIVTGESAPVEHDASEERKPLLAGTLVVRGSGRAEVTATGPSSTLGRIAKMTASAKEPKTPMQLQMSRLARSLLFAAITVSVLIPAIGTLAGRPIRDMLLTGLSLAFATIPEELPVLIVVVLGFGSLRLARRGAIVRRLRAAETLGAVTVVCTDKTGTLTENRMQIAACDDAATLLHMPSNNNSADRIVRYASLASERAGNDSTIIDPIDAAMWKVVQDAPVSAVRHFAFDGRTRLASGYVVDGDTVVAGIKGSPEAVLARSTHFRNGDSLQPLDERQRAALLAAAAQRGHAGRVLAVGSKTLRFHPQRREHVEKDLTFEGIITLRDPVRTGVRSAMEALRDASVAVTMITGDQPTTAESIAHDAGLQVREIVTGHDLKELGSETIVARARSGIIVARALPEDKLRLVTALQDAGETVMVTGDGVNDAPALRAAAVGVAMGRIGSDAAREAADVVLTDDNFNTLELAVAEGRHLYDNFRKAIRFYLAVKLALILATAAAAILGWPLPFTPVEIVILELFMDLGASLAFIALPPERDTMKRAPRNPQAPFLDRTMVLAIAFGGLTLAAVVFASFAVVLHESGIQTARTAALVAWMIGHVSLGVAMARSAGLSAFRTNVPMLAWSVASIGFAVASAFLPGLRLTLQNAPLENAVLIYITLGAVIVPLWLLLPRFKHNQ